MTEPHAGGKKEVSEAPQQPQLCVKCYEFFGNPANMNMCSSCFRTHEKATAGPTLMDVEPSPAKTIPSVLSVAPHEGGAACVCAVCILALSGGAETNRFDLFMLESHF